MPEETEKLPDRIKPRKHRGGRRAAIGFFLLVSVSLLYYRSYHHSDVMVVFGPSGKMGGLLSYRGQLLFAFSNIDVGSSRAWTIEITAASPEAGATLKSLLVDGLSASPGGGGLFGGGNVPMNPPPPGSVTMPPVVSKKWGFLVGRQEKDALGLEGKWLSLLAFPHWLLIPFALWPLMSWTARKNRQRRRRKNGCCLQCGYDLREAKDRCPECGAEIPTAQSAAQPVTGN